MRFVSIPPRPSCCFRRARRAWAHGKAPNRPGVGLDPERLPSQQAKSGGFLPPGAASLSPPSACGFAPRSAVPVRRWRVKTGPPGTRARRFSRSRSPDRHERDVPLLASDSASPSRSRSREERELRWPCPPKASPSFSPNSTACPAHDLALHRHPRLRRPRRHRQAQVLQRPLRARAPPARCRSAQRAPLRVLQPLAKPRQDQMSTSAYPPGGSPSITLSTS